MDYELIPKLILKYAFQYIVYMDFGLTMDYLDVQLGYWVFLSLRKYFFAKRNLIFAQYNLRGETKDLRGLRPSSY